MKKRYGIGILVGLLCILFLTACSQEHDSRNLLEEPYQEEEFLLGTYTKIRIYDEGKKAALKPAFDRIEELGDKITINQAGSEIDAINEQAGVKPVKVSKDVYGLLQKAYEYSDQSEAGFNMAIGAITQLWRIGFDDAKKPTQTEIDEALKHIDYHQVIFNDQEQTVYLEDEQMLLDLGAIAKGYIADEVVKVLQEQEVTTAIIDLGGNVFVMGNSPRGEAVPWNVGIQDPNEARGSVIGTVQESNKTVVTSGIYERYLEVDGQKYHHIFDSKTGYPIDNELASVSIITDSSLDADALTTLVFSKGLEAGLAYVENQAPAGTQAIFVTKDDRVYLTQGLQDNFQLAKDSNYTLGDVSEIK
ncbi:MAG: FAD:protein FMN transferase [Enterococcus sp.]